jgi:hypothetical protein
VAGENDLAQNPFDLAAEHGPSLFDARHRLALSGSYEFPKLKDGPGAAKFILNGWQFNGILQFRAECFNATNHANFFLPGNGIAELRADSSGTPATPFPVRFEASVLVWCGASDARYRGENDMRRRLYLRIVQLEKPRRPARSSCRRRLDSGRCRFRVSAVRPEFAPRPMVDLRGP